MNRLKSLFVLALALLLAACGSGGGGTADAIDDAIGEIADGETTEEPTVKEWHLVSGAQLEGITKVRGFGCNDDWLYVNVEGTTSKGLFAWDFDEEPALGQVFGGVGVTEVLNSGVLVASYGTNNTTAVVGVDPEGTATDMGFAFENLEVRAMSYSGSHLITFSKDWTAAEYMVHRAKLPDGAFEQVGPRLNETGMGLYATPDTIHVLTVMNEVMGTACHQLSLTAGAEAMYEDCPFFPDYVADKGGEPYSVNAQMYGEGARMGLWFRVSDKGEQTARHYIATDKIKWTEVEGFPGIEPTAWFHDGEAIYVGLSKSGGKPAAWTAPYDGSSPAEAIGEGLPATGDKTGAAGFCAAGTQLYLAWFEYNPGGSALKLYRRTR